MPTAQLMPTTRQQFRDANGLPLANGTVTFYEAGTTNLQAAYQDKSASQAHANPLTLDLNGEEEIWFRTDLSYKIVVKDSLGATVDTIDNVKHNNLGSITSDMITWPIAGSGLTLNGSNKLDVNVDNSTIELSLVTFLLRIKDLGVTAAKIAVDAVTTNKIINSAVTTPKIADGAITPSKLAPLNYKYAALGSGEWSYVVSAVGPYTVTAISRTANLVTVVTSGTPAYEVGRLVSFSGFASTSFNKTLLCIGCSGANAYFYQVGADEVGVVGSGVMSGSLGFVPSHQSSQNVSTISRSSNIVTVAKATALTQTFKVGQKLVVFGSAGASTSFNGVHTITEVNSSNVKFAQNGPDESGTAATGTFRGLIAVAITSSGRPLVCEAYGGYLSASTTGTGSLKTNIYRDGFEAGDALGVIDSIVSAFPASTISKTPATPFVASSSGGAVTSALSLSIGGTNNMIVPSTVLSTNDFDVTAGTHEYFPVLTALTVAADTTISWRSGNFAIREL